MTAFPSGWHVLPATWSFGGLSLREDGTLIGCSLFVAGWSVSEKGDVALFRLSLYFVYVCVLTLQPGL